MKIMQEGKAFNGNTVRIIYEQFDLGNKYKIKYKKPDEYGFRFDTSWATYGEAYRYYQKLLTGGMSR